jgi:hypothetical protein
LRSRRRLHVVLPQPEAKSSKDHLARRRYEDEKTWSPHSADRSRYLFRFLAACRLRAPLERLQGTHLLEDTYRSMPPHILQGLSGVILGKRWVGTLSRSGVRLRLPAPRHKFVDAILRPTVDEARQQLGHVGQRIDFMELTGFD